MLLDSFRKLCIRNNFLVIIERRRAVLSTPDFSALNSRLSTDNSQLILRYNPVPMRIAIDTGGTFTDCVFVRNGRLEVLKLPSTPRNPADAIEVALEKILGAVAGTHPKGLDLICGTTVR